DLHTGKRASVVIDQPTHLKAGAISAHEVAKTRYLCAMHFLTGHVEASSHLKATHTVSIAGQYIHRHIVFYQPAHGQVRPQHWQEGYLGKSSLYQVGVLGSRKQLA